MNEKKPASILAIDVGEKRIGVARADALARLPQPLRTLEASPQSPQDIAELAGEEGAKIIVVGWPRNLSGAETLQTATVKRFADQLRSETSIPIQFQDETLTSVEAKAELESRGMPYNKEDVDMLAAVQILSDWLANNHSREL